MGYDPKQAYTAARGVDIVVVSTNPEERDIEKNPTVDYGPQTTVFVTIPPYYELGKKDVLWKDKVMNAMHEAGFETVWDWQAKFGTSDIKTGSLMKLFIPEKTFQESLPELAIKFKDAFTPLFLNEERKKDWHNLLEDNFDDRDIAKLIRTAERDNNRKDLFSKLSEAIQLLILPILSPYIFHSNQEKEKEIWKRLASEKDRNSYFRELADIGVINGTFMTSSVPAYSDSVTIRQKTDEKPQLSLLIPYTYWRSGGAVITAMSDEFKNIGADVSLQFGSSGSRVKQYDPLGSRQMFTLYVNIQHSDSTVLAHIKEKAQAILNNHGRSEIAVVLDAPQFIDQPKCDTIQGSYIKPGDEENKRRSIAPSVYIHLQGEKALERFECIQTWAQKNGIQVNRSEQMDRPHWYIGCYISKKPETISPKSPSMDTVYGRTRLATAVARLLNTDGHNEVQLFQPKTRIKHSIQESRDGSRSCIIRMPLPFNQLEMEPTIPISNTAHVLTVVADALVDKGWKRTDKTRHVHFEMPLGSKETDLETVKSKYTDCLTMLGMILDHAREQGENNIILEERSKKEDRLHARLIEMEESVKTFSNRLDRSIDRVNHFVEGDNTQELTEIILQMDEYDVDYLEQDYEITL